MHYMHALLAQSLARSSLVHTLYTDCIDGISVEIKTERVLPLFPTPSPFAPTPPWAPDVLQPIRMRMVRVILLTTLPISIVLMRIILITITLLTTVTIRQYESLSYTFTLLLPFSHALYACTVYT